MIILNVFREQSISNKKMWQTTLKFCKTDVLISVTFVALCTINFAYVLIGSNFVTTNRFHLPFNCQIFFLRVDKSLWNWTVNYIFQLFIILGGSLLYMSRFVVTLILMDQSSWLVESVIVKINEINEKIAGEKFEIFLKEVVEETIEVIDWLSANKLFLRMFFLADLKLLATVFCLYIYSMMIRDSGNFQAMAFLSELFMLFQLCWMGSKLNTKLSTLSAEIYAQNWHMFNVRHQNDLKLILQMSQKIKGFDGVFKPVDLATFQQVRIYNLIDN